MVNDYKNSSDPCIRCSACMTVCPVSRVTSDFPGPKQAGPGAQRFRRREDPSVDSWIELCIGCHLCNLTCPSGVNISDLNLKAKAKYIEEKGKPLRDWILSHIYFLGNFGSTFSPIINKFIKNYAVKWFLDKFLRIEKTRGFPKYSSQTLRKWFKNHHSKGKRKIAYFYGCFTNTNEVEVGKATIEVLEANDFEVILPKQICCGIPMIGIGDLKGAKKMAIKNTQYLLKSIRSRIDVIFTSTSCGYMIKHGYYRDLNILEAREISEHLFDIFEFLRDLKESGYLNLSFKKIPIKAAYFAPCHLKALGIGLPAMEILRLIPDFKLEYINVDCCGLGGTYGFKKERYEISQKIGKNLNEAIQRLRPEIILTDCEGCRMQIRHLTGMEVLHPIQILRNAI